jgi:hypothetical protein
MATITRYTQGMSSPSSGDLQTTIDTLFSNIAAGKIVYAGDINSLISTYNSFLNHYHVIDDLYGIQDYGDGLGSPYSSAGNYETDTSSVGIMTYSTMSTISAGDTFTADKHNEMVNYINGIQGHYHTWDDRTS